METSTAEQAGEIESIDGCAPSIRRAFDELAAVRRAMLAAEAATPPVHETRTASARNLAHYLALRAREMRPLQERLAHLGLSSLGRCESHALASVDAVLATLGTLSSRRPEAPSMPHGSDFELGRQALDRNTDALLGGAREGRRVRILVTLSPEAADRERLRSWIEQGMDCVRINCAHDGPEQWESMISSLRRAEKEAGRRLRIFMDLAGPKLRTGPIEPGPCLLRIKPERDACGRVPVPALVWLSPRADQGRQRALALPVSHDTVAALAVGDTIRFVDARGARRRLEVVGLQDGGAWAETSESCYVLSGTELRKGKKRIGKVGAIPPVEGVMRLRRGDFLRLTRSLAPGHGEVLDRFGRLLSPATIGCTLGEIFARVGAGERMWLDDGRIGCIVRDASEECLLVQVTEARDAGENLRADKGINLPDSQLDLPALTAKDRQDLEFVVRHADAVGLSFVHRAEDVHELTAHLSRLGRPDLGVVLKIETRRAFERLPELLFAAMRSPRVGVMIARGDLAVECGWERMAEAQEEILWLSEAAHVPVIWATQVLESLAKNGQPSRAEITDAAMSERAECVMLNKGPHVGEALASLDGILRRMQAHQRKKSPMLRPLRVAADYRGPVERPVPLAAPERDAVNGTPATVAAVVRPEGPREARLESG